MANNWYLPNSKDANVEGRLAAAELFLKEVVMDENLRKEVIGLTEKESQKAHDKFKTIGKIDDLPPGVKVLCVHDNRDPDTISRANLVVFVIPKEITELIDVQKYWIAAWQPYRD